MRKINKYLFNLFLNIIDSNKMRFCVINNVIILIHFNTSTEMKNDQAFKIIQNLDAVILMLRIMKTL